MKKKTIGGQTREPKKTVGKDQPNHGGVDLRKQVQK